MKKYVLFLAVAIFAAVSAVCESGEEKISAVISKMSERARREIKISDTKAFLSDLESVLAEEKNFPEDDLSLYFLIDKKTFCGSHLCAKKSRFSLKIILFLT
jgi:hypothetical protein